MSTLTLNRVIVRTCACGETQAPDGRCLNVGGCETADKQAASDGARGATMKAAPSAFTRSGNVD